MAPHYTTSTLRYAKLNSSLIPEENPQAKTWKFLVYQKGDGWNIEGRKMGLPALANTWHFQ
jgi:hypothetical protein